MTSSPPPQAPIDNHPEPLIVDGIVAPDADWQTIRDDAVSRLWETGWTDHNLSDPGITMLEAGSLAVADAHYRTSSHSSANDSFASGMGRDKVHWSGIDLPTATDDVVTLARTLADHRSAIEAHLANATDRTNALVLVSTDPVIDVDHRTAESIIRLLREPLATVAAMDKSVSIDAALETAGTAHGAKELLRVDPAFDNLWDAELDDLLRLRARRRIEDRVNELRSVIAAAGDIGAAAEVVAGEPLTPNEVVAAVAHHPRPDAPPEFFESTDGSSLVWPPTAIQARSVEPIVGDDYVRLAVAVPGVRRAWLRSGRLAGVGWNGEPVTPSNHLGASTILIEPTEDAPADLEREVLRSLSRPGEPAEVDHPYQLYRNDLTLAAPRRVIGDEIGVATLSICLLEVRGVLHVAAGTVDDRATVIAAARNRLSDLLTGGRPESHPETNGGLTDAAVDTDIDGPWPVPPPPPPGWIPGEAIRFSEVIQRLTDDPVVLGTSAIGLRRAGGAWTMAGTTTIGHFDLPPDCVPRLAGEDCLTVSFELRGS